MKYLQSLGKSFSFPISCLPISAMLIALGYFLENIYKFINIDIIIILANILFFTGETIITNLPLLFVIGISFGLAKEKDISAVLSGIICWFIFQKMLSYEYMLVILGNENLDFFYNQNNILIAIISGIIASKCYNNFKDIKFNEIFAFFGGKRFVFIMSVLYSIICCIFLIFTLPFINTILLKIADIIRSTGAFGAGIYGFLNRILIPTGLHYTLNSIFLFDTIGINDMGNFWLGNDINGQTGIYMTGFYPITIFALPAVALAIYKTAKKENKSFIVKTLLIAGISSCLTGVTETIEFEIMFISPYLYFLHCLLTAFSMFLCAILPVRAGFSLSGGVLDLLFSSITPLAKNVLYIIPIGLLFFVIYYFLFKFIILKFNLKTMGRKEIEQDKKEEKFSEMAKIIINGLGGFENIKTMDNCVTRLRIEIKDKNKIDENKIKECKISGIFYPTEKNIQIVIGNNVQFIANEIKKQLKNKS